MLLVKLVIEGTEMDRPRRVRCHWIARLADHLNRRSSGRRRCVPVPREKMAGCDTLLSVSKRLRYDQNQEIERLRYRINALMDRTAKLHQYESRASVACGVGRED